MPTAPPQKPKRLSRNPEKCVATAGLTRDQLWRMYLLMRGGIDEKALLRLAKLAGVPVRKLFNRDLNRLFLWCDDRFLKVFGKNSPAVELATDEETGLPFQVVCGRCGCRTNVMPCPECDKRNKKRGWDSKTRVERMLVDWIPRREQKLGFNPFSAYRTNTVEGGADDQGVQSPRDYGNLLNALNARGWK